MPRSPKKAKSPPSKPASSWSRRLRSTAITLGLISTISYTPSSIVEKLPENLREAVRITVDIRKLLVEVGSDTGQGIAKLFHYATENGLELPSAFEDWRSKLPDIPSLNTENPAQENELPKTPGSFSTAKRYLYERIYRGHRVTFYCGCKYDGDNDVDLRSCGLGTLVGNTRAERVEAEHVFPAWQFGNFRKCWRKPEAFSECKTSGGKVESGRDCCERVDPVFKSAHNDLYNLYPAVGFVNGQRSNYNWGLVTGRSAETFGTCKIRIDSSNRRAEPPAAVRGDIARTMLYFRDTYEFRLSRQDEQLYRAWNNQDPPDDWERERNRRIKRIQGKGNFYIEDYRRL